MSNFIMFEPRITSDYWKGPFYRLEAEGFECVLADAKQVKHLAGAPEPGPG